jgi:hypothetical protein
MPPGSTVGSSARWDIAAKGYPVCVEAHSRPAWGCVWCGGAAEDEQSLLDHQEWCLGDPEANTRLLSEVAQRDGELTQDALVAAAKQRRKARSG